VAAGSLGERPAAQLLAEADLPHATRDVPRLEPGTRLGRYEIRGLAGAGGMGEVYEAFDTQLRRRVAIKTISAAAVDGASRQRLIREARHASTLRHPGICTIHEISDAGEPPFIVMEYAEGRTLSDLRRERRPGAPVAVRCGIQIADALAHAHGKGIIHRDLKSSNVIIGPDGRVMVLDFGLSKRLPDAEAAPETTVTAPLAFAGTLSCMAPEVLLGATADARSDVWSLGVLLYEMAAGSLPFDGRTSFETTWAIIGGSPPPLPRDVPLALRLIIERCLAKEPSRRYQTAAEVRDALQAVQRRRVWRTITGLSLPRWRRTAVRLAVLAGIVLLVAVAAVSLSRRWGAPAGPAIMTLAVAPFVNATGDATVQYFADGMTDAIVAQVGALGSVRVISPGSVRRVADRSVTGIATVLGADAVVEGTIARSEDRVQVAVRLAEGATGRVLWADEFERAAPEVLVLQADLVNRLATAVRAAVPPRMQQRLTAVRAVNPAAYEAYLKGRFFWNQRTRSSIERAVAEFTRALSIDPTYAPAHAALADCYNQLATVLVGGGPPTAYRPRAAAEAIKALQIDADLAEAHAALGYVRHYQWRWDEAESQLRRAIELNPSYALAHLWYANLLMSRQRFDEALREVFAARDLDPLSPIVNSNVGWILFHAGRFDDAVAQMTRTLELDPDYPQAHFRIVGPLASLGRLDEALQHATRFAELTKRSPSSVALLGELHVRLGQRAKAQSFLQEVKAMAAREYVPPSTTASLHVLLGEVDAAFDDLERAFAEQSNQMAYVAAEPSLAPLRGDARFLSLMRRTGLR
jgi:serine/threonine-protein kinase